MILKDITTVGYNVSDVEAIKTAIHNILNINRGEIPFRRNFGSKIEEHLFSPITKINSIKLKSEILRAIGNHLPYTNIDNITIIPDVDKKSYHVRINLIVENLGEILFETDLTI